MERSKTAPLIVFTIALTSLLSSLHVCAFVDQELDYVPTLKEIYGGVPKNSFPVVHRMIQTNKELSSHSKNTKSASESLRRALRAKSVAFNVPVTDVNPQQGAYFAEFQLGTPPQSVLMLIDTGSQDFWVQSNECTVCYPELLPRYDPNNSTTFKPGNISWSISYAGGNGNSGHSATDTLTIDSGDDNKIVIPDFQVGVSVNNSGPSSESSGLIGLMGYNPSNDLTPFLAQLKTLSNGKYKNFSNKFRYCFPDRSAQYSTTSFLSFGEIDEEETNFLFSATHHLYASKFLWTPLVLNEPYMFYVLNLTAISVGGYRISIAPEELTPEAVNNYTMTVIDSGTTLNLLREPYFTQFLLAYYNATSNLDPSLSGGLLTYNITQDVFDGYIFPTVSFFFQKWDKHGASLEEIEVVLPKNDVFYGTGPPYQISFQEASGTQNLIGNYGQMGFLIEYDLVLNRVGFLRASCTFEY